MSRIALLKELESVGGGGVSGGGVGGGGGQATQPGEEVYEVKNKRWVSVVI